LEVLDRLGKEKGSFRLAILWTLGLSFVTGAFAILTGLLLEKQGLHGGDTLNSHKILGISVVVLTAIAFFAKLLRTSYAPRWSIGVAAVILVLLSATGHLGGELTHGKTYLSEYAPAPLKPLLGGESQPYVDLADLHADSVLVYQHAIQPIIEAKCVRCHNDEETRGGLNLTTFAGLFEESATGTAVVAGNLETSVLFERVTLSPSNRKFMPPSGNALSYPEINLMKWWIEQGADSLQRFSSDAMDDEMIAMVLREYGKDYYPKPYYERVQVEATDRETLAKLEANGFSATALGAENFLLDVAFGGKEMGAEHYNMITNIAEEITFLDLSEAHIPNEIFQTISTMKHLTRLDLHGSNVTDEVLKSFSGLKQLESINLYNTAITDEGLAALTSLENLKRIYLWQTQTSEDYIAQLGTANPDLQLIAGFNWN
ncbi:MAG: c-type cytochrome domain-containing protein, partial [Bacteroidota bacterium]